MSTLKNPNVAPQNAKNFKVQFTTTNLDNGSVFLEPFIVSGPSGSFNVPLNSTTNGGSKVFIPLTSNTSEGANYLKIHLPQPDSSELYITFAKKASSMFDGYYDYITGIPDDYRTDLRNWILDGRSIPTAPINLTKTLVFSVIGKDTNQSSEAIQFVIKITAKIGTPIVTPPTSGGVSDS